MLITDKDALARIGSPLNLLNRLRDSNNSSKSSKGMSLFTGSVAQRVTEPVIQKFDPFAREAIIPAELVSSSDNDDSHTTKSAVLVSDSQSNPYEDNNNRNNQEANLDNLVDNADARIKLAHAHDSALGVLNEAVKMLGANLDNINPDKLPSVISATSKVVESIRKERNEAAKSKSGKEVHLHFYTPNQKSVSDYEVVEVG